MWMSDVRGEASEKSNVHRETIIQHQQVLRPLDWTAPGRLEMGSANCAVHGVQVKASADSPLQMWRKRLRRSEPALETMGLIFFI